MKAFGITDIGQVRSVNQDTYAILPLSDEAGLSIVCDGMGGPGGGQIASEMAVRSITQDIKAHYHSPMEADEIKKMIADAVKRANAKVFKKSTTAEELAGMGTTMVLAIYGNGRAIVANIGDSRAYVVNGGSIAQVTKDHSIVQQMLDSGQISKFEARSHPKKNIITRALGVDLVCQADFFEVSLQKNDFLILCSDGLSNYVDENELAFELSVCDDPADALKKFVAMANARGGSDNITAVTVAG